jgi:transposase
MSESHHRRSLANRVYSRWSEAPLQNLIRYKAALAGSFAITVDADYTSQTCPMCGYRSGENRPEIGLLFVCHNEECRYTLHAADGGREKCDHENASGPARLDQDGHPVNVP